jgi:glycosyltransferase involved in cell wall biosynthesis
MFSFVSSPNNSGRTRKVAMAEHAQRPSVSVVIPTYNAGQFVTQAIDSVLAQTIRPEEILVIDDGSTDDTKERLRPYLGAIRYIFQANQGVSATRNHGVREARGELVAFLDADDVWHPQKLALQMQVLAARPDLGFLSTQRFPWPAPGYPEIDGADPQAFLVPIPWSRLVVQNLLDTSSIVCRREVLEAVGPFDTRMQGPEDHDLWVRIAEVAPITHLNLPLMGYRQVPGSLSKQADRMWAHKHIMLRKLDERKAWGQHRLLRRKAYSYVNYSCSYIYAEAGRHGMALLCLLRSLARFPLPYARDEVPTTWARPKSSIIAVLRLLGLRQAPENKKAVQTDECLSPALAQCRESA